MQHIGYDRQWKHRRNFTEMHLRQPYDELGSKVIRALSLGVAEVQQAAQRFGENIGQILDHEDVLKSAMENWEKADKDLKRIEQLQQICKGDKTEPQKQEEPKADQTPEPTEPTPATEPKPTRLKPSPTPPEGAANGRTHSHREPGDEEPPISPPPPTSEPRQVGLPYSPEECGCEQDEKHKRKLSRIFNSSGWSKEYRRLC